MRPKAIKRAEAAARRLKAETGAMYTICIAADVDQAKGENAIAVGTQAPSSDLVAAILQAIARQMTQQKPRLTVDIKGRVPM